MKRKASFLSVVILICLLGGKQGLYASRSNFNSTYGLDSLKKVSVLIPAINGKFSFDGHVDDPCWDKLTPLPLVMHVPTFGNEPTEKTQIYMCHDNTYIYFAGRFYDREAQKINVSSKMRDNFGPEDDAFCVLFDSFNDHENGVGFNINSAGVRMDMTVDHDEASGMGWDNTWNTFWDAKTSRDSMGWYAEVRIPLSSLRFEESNGKVKMGLIAWRFIPRKFELDLFPAIPRKWGFWSFLKVSQANEVEMEGVHSKKPLYIAPYITTGFNQQSMLKGDNSGYYMHNDPKFTGGLDVKYGLTNNLTADLTLNTDFAQVEADNAQINLTRFSLFFPEKRTFFQERSSNFAFAFDDMNTLFYSRQIGLHEGSAVPIIGGARIVGRAGPWDIGFLDMQTSAFKSKETGGTNLPSENFGVLRMRRQVFNANSYLGGILTSRLGADGTFNEVLGIDGIIRPFGDEYLDIKYAQSFDEKYQNKIISPAASKFWFDWQRRNEKGFGYDFFYSRAGANYEPDMGFEFRKNYYMYGSKLKYGIIGSENSKISTQTIILNGQAWTDITSNHTQSALVSASYNLFFKSSSGILIGLNHEYEYLTDTFTLSNDRVISFVRPGNYGFNYLNFDIHSPYTNKWNIELISNLGQYYDGNQATFRLMATVKFGSWLNLSPALEYDRIRFPSRNQAFNGKVASVSALLMLNNKLSVSSLVQYSNIAHGILTNLRLRYNPREGNDFYLVFNQGRNIELTRETPTLNLIDNWGILLKYTYTFTL